MWYAGISFILAGLALLVQGIAFIPDVGKPAVNWLPWIVFTAAAVAFGFGIAGFRSNSSAGKVKTYAGIGIALTVFTALLLIAWIVYYNQYLLTH